MISDEFRKRLEAVETVSDLCRVAGGVTAMDGNLEEVVGKIADLMVVLFWDVTLAFLRIAPSFPSVSMQNLSVTEAIKHREVLGSPEDALLIASQCIEEDQPNGAATLKASREGVIPMLVVTDRITASELRWIIIETEAFKAPAQVRDTVAEDAVAQSARLFQDADAVLQFVPLIRICPQACNRMLLWAAEHEQALGGLRLLVARSDCSTAYKISRRMLPARRYVGTFCR